MNHQLQPLDTTSKTSLEAHEEQVERFRTIKVLKLKIKWMEALTQQAQMQLQEIEQDLPSDTNLNASGLDGILSDPDLHPLEEPGPSDLGF